MIPAVSRVKPAVSRAHRRFKRPLNTTSCKFLYNKLFIREGISRLGGLNMAGKWLLKSDPEHYSFFDLERDGKTVWDGISNNLALKNLRNVRKGDGVMVYHTGSERALVGLAEAASDPYPDPQQEDARLVVIDLRAKKKLARAVSLDEIKKYSALKGFDLIRLPRLSVMPVSDVHWDALLAMAAKKSG
jgi:predicted RNA-binding protein with PUA-like domain